MPGKLIISILLIILILIIGALIFFYCSGDFTIPTVDAPLEGAIGYAV